MVTKKTKTKEEDDDFNFIDWLKGLKLNKYVKKGFTTSLKGEIPRNEKEAKKYLKKYMEE